MVKISIIIPVYNVEKYLSDCLDSVLCQTFKDFEVICVNDGSKDASPKLCDDYAEHNEYIKVIHQKNKGLSEARNTGLKEARGDYVFFLDSDDFLEKECLEKLYNLAIKDDAQVVVCNVNLFEDWTLKKTPKNYWNLYHSGSVQKNEINKEFLISPCWAWNKLYLKSFLEEKQINFIPNILYEDVPFFVETMLSTDKISFCVDYLYNYRVGREGSITVKKSEKQLDIVKVNLIVQKLLDSYKADAILYQNFSQWKKYNYLWMYIHLPSFLHSKAIKEIFKLNDGERTWILHQINVFKKWIYVGIVPVLSIKCVSSRIDIFLFDFIPLVTIKRKKV